MPGLRVQIKMIESFKKVTGHIIGFFVVHVLGRILKYVPEIQGVDEAVGIRPRYLTFVLDQAVRRRPWGLKHVSDDLKDQGIREWVVYKNPRMLEYVPDHSKTREMCNDVVMEHLLLLRHVPDWFATQQKLRQCDDCYDDNGYIKWYDGYKKRKAQKAKIKKRVNAHCLASIKMVGLVYS